MRADSTMTREVTAVPPELSLEKAYALMRRIRVRHLPVVQHGRLVGILSDRDLLLYGQPGEGDGGVEIPDGLVGEAMSLAPVTCPRSASVSWLAEQMILRKIDAVPVVDAADHLVGLVTTSDLLALLIERDEDRKLPFEFDLRIDNGDDATA